MKDLSLFAHQQQHHQPGEVSEYRHRRQHQRREVHEDRRGRHHSATATSSSSTATYEVTSTAVRHDSLNRRDNYRRHERKASLETFKPNNSGRL